MNSPIKVLDQKTINLIAAGEIIERPASIVKELIENSLDAKTSSITIEIHGSGQPFIMVSDDGQGMSKDDLTLALERHATSKINSANDLFDIKTFGFRGEALPSIAGVSKLQITSKKRDEKLNGVELCAEGGSIISIEDKGAPSGTTVVVKDVFYNLPARRKYLKKDITEFSHVYNLVEKFIIANPDVKFKLLHNGKEMISSLGNSNMLDVLVTVFGRKIKDDILNFELNRGLISVKGYVGQPQITYPNRSKEIIFVNGRFVYAGLLARTIEEEYRGLIPSGRFPLAIVFVDIDPKQIDVNVHPTKKEIRFEKVNHVLSILRDAVRSRLKNSEKSVSMVENNIFQGDITSCEMKDKKIEEIYRDEELKPVFEYMTITNADQYPLFQHKNTYLVTIWDSNLVIIDQHVAHERILYERLSEVDPKGAKSQQLLLPLNLEVSSLEKKIILDIKEEIEKLGYIIEEFGHNSFVVRGVPPGLYEQDHVALLRDLIEEFKDSKDKKNIEEIKEKILVTISCKAAVKAGKKLSIEEMRKLISNLKHSKHPQTCPHGRPIIIKFSEEAIQKLFKRR